MWPFKKPKLPDPVTVGGVTASFSRQTDQWEMIVDGIDFTYGPRDFDPDVIEWAQTVAPIVNRMKELILKAACDSVADFGDLVCTDAAEILSVDLTDYSSQGYAGVDVAGDDSWGDLGVTVTIKDGQIVAADAGD